MEQIERLLQEYKIRFRDTDRILEKEYPSEFKRIILSELNTGKYFPEISIVGSIIKIDNKNGIICRKYNDNPIIWATADLKEAPDRWVVEKDKNHPMWEKFREWWTKQWKMAYRDVYFNSYGYRSMQLNSNEGYQYLTLDQWAEFFLPKIIDFNVEHTRSGGLKNKNFQL